MTKSSFIDTERNRGEMWGQILSQFMAEAGRRERELAIEKGCYEGIPTIIVIADEARGLTNTLTMPSLVWQLSLARRQGSFAT